MDDGPQTAADVVVGAEGNGMMVAVTEVRVLSQVPLSIETKKVVVELSIGDV